MFLGHFALALATKKAESRMSLATTIMAAELADIVWPVLVLTHVERVAIAPGDTVVTPLRFESYPYSHSLLCLALWATLFAGGHYLVVRRGKAAALLWGLVVSHWVLDFASHRPDMPLTPWGSTRLGLSLWDSFPVTLLLEGGLFAAGVGLAVASTRALDGIGRWGFRVFVAFLILAYLSAVLGPPPPSVEVLGWTSLAAPVVLLPFVFWFEGHRAPRGI